MTEPRTLIALIRDLDGESCDCDHGATYSQVMRWKDGSGESDDEATALFRQLLRAELGTFPVDAIGAAVLADIDSRGGDT